MEKYSGNRSEWYSVIFMKEIDVWKERNLIIAYMQSLKKSKRYLSVKKLFHFELEKGSDQIKILLYVLFNINVLK